MKKVSAKVTKVAPISVRLTPEALKALQKAALDDERPLAAMAGKAVTDWLREKGYLR
jgi:hypothetical protein